MTAIVFGIGALGLALALNDINTKLDANDDTITKVTTYISTLETDYNTYNTRQTSVCTNVSQINHSNLQPGPRKIIQIRF